MQIVSYLAITLDSAYSITNAGMLKSRDA
jgi:hypothetical protein